MDIHNVTEFRNFINGNKLSGLDPAIAAVGVCVTDYERGCSCWKAGDRQKIYNNCKALYIKAVGIIVTKFATQFSEKVVDKKITFSQDGITIGGVGR